jgi:hypothetical protein
METVTQASPSHTGTHVEPSQSVEELTNTQAGFNLNEEESKKNSPANEGTA